MDNSVRTYTTRIFLNDEQAKKRLEELTAKVEDLRKKQDEAARAGDWKTFNNLKRELTQATKEMDSMKTSAQKVERVLNDLSGASVKEIRRTITAINKELASGSVRRGSEEWKFLNEQLRRCKEELKNIKSESEAAVSTGVASGTASGGVMGFLRRFLPDTFLASVGSAGSAFTGFVNAVKAGIASIQGAIDTAKWFYEVNIQLEQANRLTREFLDLSGERLRGVRSDIMGVCDVYGKEYKDVLQAVDALTSQYGLTAEESLGVLKDGFQSGADTSGQLLQMIGQYAPSFHDAGISARELVGIIQQTRSGIFSADGMNVIQMASKKIREMGTQTRDALQAIGMDADHVKEQLADGTVSTMDVIRDVSTHLKQLPPDAQEVGEVLRDVFGRQGANAGIQLIEQLDTMETDLDKLMGTTGEYGQLQRRQMETQKLLNERTAEMFGIGENGYEEMTALAKIFMNEGLVAIIDYTQQLYDRVDGLRWIVEAFRIAVETQMALVATCFAAVVDSVKWVAQNLMGMAEMTEGIFTLDIDKVKAGWTRVGQATVETVRNFTKQVSQVGQQWGERFVSSAQRAISGRSLEPPTVSLDEVTVTARRPRRPSVKDTPGKAGNGSRGGGGNGGGNADPLKEHAEELKKMYEWEQVQNILRYRQGLQDYRSFLDQERQLQRQSAEERLSIYEQAHQTERDEYRQLLKEKSDLEEQFKDEDLKQSQKEIERQRARRDLMAKLSYSNPASEAYLNDHALDEQLYQNQLHALMKRLQLLREAGREGTGAFLDLQADIENREQERQLARQKDWQQRLQAIRRAYGSKSAQEQEQEETEALEALHLKEQGMEEEHQKLLLAIKAKYARKALQEQGRQNGLSDEAAIGRSKAGLGQDILGSHDGLPDVGASVSNAIEAFGKLKTARDQDLISEQEYAAAKESIWDELYQNLPEMARAALSTVSDFVQAACSYAQACSDLETAKISSDYDRQIEAAGKNSRKREKLEKERDEKLRAAKTKANQRAMKIELAQAFASTAMAAIKAYEDAPAPHMIWGPIAAGMATAAGMLQIATIKKQHQAEQEGYYEGGFTGGSRYRREAGVVHEGEFVANHQAVNNPGILPMLSFIDQAQRNNTIGSLTSADVSRKLGTNTTVVSAPTVNVQTDNAELRDMLADTRDALDRLSSQLEQGIGVDVPIDGENGIYKRMKTYEQLLKNK